MSKGDVLVVDDAPESRELLADLMRLYGYTVRVAADGEQALLDATACPPDVILLDIRMPGIDGFDVCRRLKQGESTARIPVIFVSVQHATSDQVRGFGLGAVDFICKPFQPEEVLARVDTHIQLTVSRKQIEAERARLELRVAQSSAQLRGEAEVRRSFEDRLHVYQRVFATTGKCMYITDADGLLIEVNPAYCRVMEISRAQAIGQRPPELCADPDDQASVMVRDMLARHGHWAGEVWDRRSSGERFPKWLELNVICDADTGALKHYAGVFSDFSSLRRTEDKLTRMAYHDALTGLGNRALFRERLGEELACCKRHGEQLAVLFVDLDRFKHINDSFGHEGGDRYLVGVAQLLRHAVREGDLVARFGGDEFMLALRKVDGAQGAQMVAAKLLEQLAQPIVVAGQDAFGGASIGIALYPDDGQEVEQLIKHADCAMYAAKSAGRGQFRFYSPESDRLARRDVALENDLRFALGRNELEVHYQPQMDLASGSLMGVEALLRWRHPTLGWVAPARFIPIAEENGSIVEIGYWVMRQACQQLRAFNATSGSPLIMAVNLSPRQFQQANLADEIARIADEEGVEPSSLELEITETTAMQDAQAAERVLQRLASRQFGIAIDDFGTGYSSLAYLRRFPVDTIKIDRSFVREIPVNVSDAVLVSTVIRLGKSLGLRVVAEGVETLAQRHFLASHGCDILQGYWYSRPIDAHAMLEFIGATLGRAQGLEGTQVQ